MLSGCCCGYWRGGSVDVVVWCVEFISVVWCWYFEIVVGLYVGFFVVVIC